MSDHIHSFVSKWTSAELAGNTEALATLLTDDFCGIGPLGFILDRSAWLDRYRQGLAHEYFSLDETQIRFCGEVAVVTARNNSLGTYRGQPLPEELRATLVIASHSETLRLMAIHMSFIAGTVGAPSIPGPTDPGEGGADTHADRAGS
jgi:hypothetical protein